MDRAERRLSLARTIFFSKLPFLYPFLVACEVKVVEGLRKSLKAFGVATSDMKIYVEKALETDDFLLVLAHECLHVAHGHLVRFRDVWSKVEGYCKRKGIGYKTAMEVWNIVADAYINDIIREYIMEMLGIKKSLVFKIGAIYPEAIERLFNMKVDFKNQSVEEVFIEAIKRIEPKEGTGGSKSKSLGIGVGKGSKREEDEGDTSRKEKGEGRDKERSESKGGGSSIEETEEGTVYKGKLDRHVFKGEGEGKDAEEIKKEMENIRKRIEELVRQAELLQKKAGSMPAWLEGFVEWVRRKPVMDWRTVLRSTILGMGNSELSYVRISKPLFVYGRKFPSVTYLRKLNLIIGIDTSGSISDREYAHFAGEVLNILSSQPYNTSYNVYIIMWEAEVAKVIEVKNRNKLDTIMKVGKEIKKRVGYGGTCIIPFFNKCMEIIKKDRENFKIIVLTDGYIFDIDKAKEHPITKENRVKRLVWVSTGIVKRFLKLPNEIAVKLKVGE